MTYYNGASLGKMIVGIKVQSADGQKLSPGQVVLRETIGKIISGIIIYIGYIMAGFTKNKRALHDMMAKTVVVYKDPSRAKNAGLIIGIVLACVLPGIAIIGILSSIVLVSLNVARGKGHDAENKASIEQIGIGMEEYYGKGNTYSKADNCKSGVFSDPSISSFISAIVTSGVMPTCYAEDQSYAISVPMIASSTGGADFCVDSAAFNGNGVAVDDGKKASCEPDQDQNLDSDSMDQSSPINQ